MFAVVLTRATRAPPQSYGTADDLLHALTPFDQADVQGHWSDDRVLMVQALTRNTPQSRHEAAPEVCPETGRVIVSWVRLDNRAELCAALRLRDAPDLSDPQIILAAHRAWGEACADKLEGDFSFVIYAPENNDIFCVRDSIGARPFYYVLTDDVFIATTTLVALHALATPVMTPSQTWVALFVANLNWSPTEAAYEGVSKLPSAHHLTVQREGTSGPTRYFTFDLTATHATTRDPIWVERYRDAFDRAVEDRARSAYLVGAESSAGLDSSSIVARLVDVLPHAKEDFHCFGMAQTEMEPALLLATAAMCDIRHTHTLVRPEVLSLDESFERALRTIGHPPEHGQMLMHPSFFALSRQLGVRTMVSGFGGDEVVTCSGREMFDELHARGAYGTLLRELPGCAAFRLARLGKRLLRRPQDPFAHEQDKVRAKLTTSCLRNDVIVDAGLADQVEDWVTPADMAPNMNAWRGLLPGFTYGRISRLESESLFAASYGVDYRWPMLDRRLIQQFFATPAIEKRHRDMGRYLHRRALEGRVPDQILWQKTKDMGGVLGGRRNVADRSVWAFSELPDPVRSLVNQQRYEELVSRCGTLDQPVNPRDILALWQVEQLTKWLSDT